MKIYAIGDLHLSGEPPEKPMDIFEECWQNHWQKIKTDWLGKVQPGDLVLICGDISWGLNFKKALVDLQAIAALPGQKVFVRGNHDFWWSGVSKMRNTLGENCFFLHNNFYAFADVAICGSRGWLTPNLPEFSEADTKTYLRELERTERSLKLAQEAGYQKILLMLHYPPLYTDKSATGFSQLCDKYQVKQAVYGHLHGAESISLAFQGLLGSTNYHLVSADAVGFRLKLISA